MNGDGYDDLVSGCPGGAVRVWVGSAAGPSATAAVLTGPTSNFGLLLATGDLTGDGYDDLAVGDPTATSNTGQVVVYPGSAAGISTTPLSTLGTCSGTWAGAPPT